MTPYITKTSLRLGRTTISPFSSVSGLRLFSSEFTVYPSYKVFGEETALIMKGIPPEMKVVGSSGAKDLADKGRMLLEFVSREGSGRFDWARPMRFALSPEECGLVVARLKRGQLIELSRQYQPPGGEGSYTDNLQKVLRITPMPDGSANLFCDFELDGVGGQQPASPKEGSGPMKVDLMVGETQVILSILEYALPRLTGFAPILEEGINKNMNSARPNHGGGGGYGRGGGGGGYMGGGGHMGRGTPF